MIQQKAIKLAAEVARQLDEMMTNRAVKVHKFNAELERIDAEIVNARGRLLTALSIAESESKQQP